MKKIITIPNPLLRKKTEEVKKVDKKLIEFIHSLEETLINKRNPRGVGLAAPQISKLWKVFALNVNNIQTFINPRIIKKSKDIVLGPPGEEPRMEGCLSMPKLYGPVPRNSWVKIEFQSINKNKLIDNQIKLEAFEARVFQHELDHLDGILFTDHSIKYGLPVYKELGRDKYEEVEPSLLELF